MRIFIAVAALIALAHDTARRSSPPPEGCFVTQVAVIVDNVADFKYHRVVVAGIRKLQPTMDATPGNCETREASAVAAMRAAVEGQLDSVIVTAPRIRSTIELRNGSIDVVRGEIKRLAGLARDHAGTFTRVELVSVDAPFAPRASELPLPRLATSDAEAAACASDNAQLDRAGARYRWAC